jgi:Protein of unknown function (DUF1194)
MWNRRHRRRRLGLARAICGMAAAALLALILTRAPVEAQMAQKQPVDLELILAIDVSGSIDEFEAKLQRQGYQTALLNPKVIEAVRSGPLGRIALTYFEWAGEDHQTTVVDWAMVDGPESAAMFVGTLAENPPISGRRTSISAALDFAMQRFAKSHFEGTRRVIDVSGDGYNNSGRPLEDARAMALAQGVTINGLPIVNDRPGPFGWPAAVDLDKYFETNVIGGPRSFMIVANSFENFAEAILSKLIREIAWRPDDLDDPPDLAALP